MIKPLSTSSPSRLFLDEETCDKLRQRSPSEYRIECIILVRVDVNEVTTSSIMLGAGYHSVALSMHSFVLSAGLKMRRDPNFEFRQFNADLFG